MPADDPLDALLAAARWPEVPPAATRTAERVWRAASARVRRRRAVGGVVGTVIAAGLAAAVLTPRPTPTIQTGPSPTPAIWKPTPTPEGRPATAVELAMLRTARPTRSTAGVPLVPLVTGWRSPAASAVVVRTAAPSPRVAGPASRLQLVERRDGTDPAAAAALTDLLADPTTEGTALTAVSRRPAAWTDALFADLGDRRVSVRTAAARALATVGGPAVTDRLIDMADRGDRRPEAMAALVRIRSPQARRFVAAAVRRPLLAAAAQSAVAQSY